MHALDLALVAIFGFLALALLWALHRSTKRGDVIDKLLADLADKDEELHTARGETRKLRHRLVDVKATAETWRQAAYRWRDVYLTPTPPAAGSVPDVWEQLGDLDAHLDDLYPWEV